MKNVSKLVLSLSLLAAPLAFASASADVAASGSNRGDAAAPAPLVVTSPEAKAGAADTAVKLAFIVDKTEEADAALAAESDDIDFVSSLSSVDARWASATGLRIGKLVAVKVDLPRIVAIVIETNLRLILN
ncbi:MAG: hypothetical protein PHQ04_01580 [Opitutaceae bacterium]|nr:hypothetical protein [Opitutaceae bacterium]